MTRDEAFMRRALELAARARGKTSPNPLVGAVVVKDGAVVGEGYHRKAGEPHAEVHALEQAGSRARGATLYVNLEPCCHFGRTPPCTEAIIRAGIARVVAATLDPNPLVSGKGVARLREAGISVEVGVLEKEARRLNEVFFKYITTRLPFVTLKAALSLDGKIATAAGESKWITGEEARRFVHELRAQHDAVMVGIGTVLADDPSLTVRLVETERQPRRIVVDSRLRIPLESQLVRTAREVPTIVAAVAGLAPPEKKDALAARGVAVWELPGDQGRVDLGALAAALGRAEVTSVLLEGGATLNAAALAAKLVDKLVFFFAPLLIGGRDAPGPVGGEGVPRLEEAVKVAELEWRQVGRDLLVMGYPVW